MTLGETICALRTQKKLSQIELAEKLDVSRQAVSKWETDAAVPELDKLIRLSALFGVSLDELVRGQTAQTQEGAASAPQAVQAQPSAPRGAHHTNTNTVGVILLCTAAVICLSLTLLDGGLLAGLLFASPFLLCGIICLTVHRNTGLWCAWAVLGCVYAYLYYATGITWTFVRMTLIYTPEMNYFRLLIAWLMLLAGLGMSVLTALRFSRAPLAGKTRTVVPVAIGWVLLAASLLPIPTPAALRSMYTIRGVWVSVQLLTDGVRTAALTALLTLSIRLLRGLRKRKNRE